jgi:hypothetical protein
MEIVSSVDVIERTLRESSAMNRIIRTGKFAADLHALQARGHRFTLGLPLLGMLLLIVNHISVVIGHPWLIPSFLQLP